MKNENFGAGRMFRHLEGLGHRLRIRGVTRPGGIMVSVVGIAVHDIKQLEMDSGPGLRRGFIR